MQGKISIELSLCQSETGFSLDELVIKLTNIYEKGHSPNCWKVILQMVQGRRSLGCMIISAAGELI